MPEYTVESFESHDYLETFFSNANGRMSQYQWMSHYMQGNNDSIPPKCKECIHLDAINKDSNNSGRYVHAGNNKSRMVKMLHQGLSQGSTSEYKNVMRYGLNGLGLTIYSHQSTESLEAEKGFTNNSKAQKDAYLNAENTILQEGHIPLFSINHNTADAVDPKKVTVYGHNSSRASESQQSHGKMAFSSSHIIGFTAKDNHFEGQKMTRMAPGGNKFSKSRDLQTCENNVEDSTSLPVNGKFKCQVSNGTHSEFPEEKGMPSITDHVHNRNAAEDGLTSFKHDLCNTCGSSSFTALGMKGNNEKITASNSKRSWSQKKSTSMRTLGESWVGDYPLSPLVGENDKCILNYSTSRMLPHGDNFCTSVNDYPQGTQPLDKTNNCTIHNVESLRINSTSNSVENRSGKSQDISDSFQYWLTTEGMNKELSHKDQLHARLTGPGRTKPTALYEMLAVPTTSDCQSKLYGDLQCNSSNYGYDDDDNWNDTHIIETKNRPSLKTATMSMNVCQKRISPEGNVYTMRDKERFIRHKEATVPKAERMNADWIFSNAQRANESNSGSVGEGLFQVEPCSKWLKRLGHISSYPLLGMKRSRIADDLSCDIAFSKSVNYKASSLMENVTEQRAVVDKNLHGDAENSSDVSEKEMQIWIGRWCHKGTQPSPEQSSPEYLELKSSEEKQFPSIAAMALMAKVMNGSHKCEFQKRGSSTVWKTGGL